MNVCASTTNSTIPPKFGSKCYGLSQALVRVTGVESLVLRYHDISVTHTTFQNHKSNSNSITNLTITIHLFSIPQSLLPWLAPMVLLWGISLTRHFESGSNLDFPHKATPIEPLLQKILALNSLNSPGNLG